ncbi:MAG TPA: hypothetical protein PK329_05185 [Myxococcota bacterium]|nr:hypothetical protein [Myxococcota bacterium]HON24887.1 hypothetical protein [Myxococcota bacterium]HOS62391.1 hypothetical protein [Myxococcota bacterium]HPC92051.1 hypothetical protein [Myxococcota bacterium]HPL25453.1 hypothetical protein [Myxococcota bacterium]
MNQDSKLMTNKRLRISTAVIFGSMAFYLVCQNGCTSDVVSGPEAIEALCKQLEACSMLDTWGYESVEHCKSSEARGWDKYEGCLDKMTTVTLCYSNLKCDQLSYERAAALCREPRTDLYDCMVKLYEDGEDDDSDDLGHDYYGYDASEDELVDGYCETLESCGNLKSWAFESLDDCKDQQYDNFRRLAPCKTEFGAVLSCWMSQSCEARTPAEYRNHCQDIKQDLDNCIRQASLEGKLPS